MPDIPCARTEGALPWSSISQSRFSLKLVEGFASKQTQRRRYQLSYLLLRWRSF
jgi:hypothetical protein